MNQINVDTMIAAAPKPSGLSQATAIEQSRAVAEVQAAILVAKAEPRDIDRARREMQISCSQMGMADRAFFTFPRAGKAVTGSTIHLARELARCFGNIQYGFGELSRGATESEMMAWAWDLELNALSRQTFIVPHRRDTKGGTLALKTDRDIYEVSANMGARRLRAAIGAILPIWFVDEAEEMCRQTLTRGESVPLTGGGSGSSTKGAAKSLAERRAKAVVALEVYNVTQGQIEARLGVKMAEWTPENLATLRIDLRSIKEGAVKVGEVFPAERVTTAELAK